MKKYKNRKKNTRTLLIAVVLSVFMIGVALVPKDRWMTSDASGEVSDVAYVERIVQPGDTLWKIAEKHHDQTRDIRSFIAEIVSANDLQGAMIQPGQTLRIPVLK